MNRLAHWMMRLYPSRWRKRYGDELDALLTETGADGHIVANLAAGGIRMQFSTWSFTKLAIVLGTAGVLLGGLGSFLIAPTYISEATLHIDPALEQRLEPTVLSRGSLSRIINDPRALLYRHEQQVKPLEDIIENMRRNITIAPASQSGNFTISFRYRDPEETRSVVKNIAEQFAILAALEEAPRDFPRTAYVDVIDNASLPIRPFIPIHIIMPWLVAALALWGLVAWRRRRRKSFFTWGFGLAVVATLLVGLTAGSLFAVLATNDGYSHLPGVRYQSTALVRLNGTPEQNQRLLRNVLNPTSLASFLSKAARKNSPGPWDEWFNNQNIVARELREHLTVTPAATDPHYFRIAYESRDRFEAQITATAIIGAIVKAASTETSAPDSASSVRIEPALLRLPSLPETPVKPNHVTAAAVGGLAGLFLAALIALFRNRWKPEPELPFNPVSE